MVSPEEIEKISDEEIVTLSLENQDYFSYIIDRYKRKLFNYIQRLTNIRDEDAEDLLQEIFLKVYLNLNDFDPELKFSSWIYAISRNQIISNHRKIQARVEGHSVPLEDEVARKIASGFNMEKELDASFLSENITKALDGLADKYREVLVLKFLEEKNYQEISDIIKKPFGTVASMINKAKQEFRKEIERQNLKM